MTYIKLFNAITNLIMNIESYPDLAPYLESDIEKLTGCIELILTQKPITDELAVITMQACKVNGFDSHQLFELREYFADVHDINLESDYD